MINDRAVLLLFLHHAWLCYFCFSQVSNGLWYVAIENINYNTELSNHDGHVSVDWMYAATQWPKDTEWKKGKVIIEGEMKEVFLYKGKLILIWPLILVKALFLDQLEIEWACFDFWMKFTWYAKFLILKAMDIVSMPCNWWGRCSLPTARHIAQLCLCVLSVYV
jgi:hypothetical protein